MNLEAYLENLRAKPEHVRRRFALWSSFGVTAIIFLFWLASLTIPGGNAKDVVTQAVSNVGTPSQSMIAGVGVLFSDIRDVIFGPKKIEYSALEVSPGNR